VGDSKAASPNRRSVVKSGLSIGAVGNPPWLLLPWENSQIPFLFPDAQSRMRRSAVVMPSHQTVQLLRLGGTAPRHWRGLIFLDLR